MPNELGNDDQFDALDSLEGLELGEGGFEFSVPDDPGEGAGQPDGQGADPAPDDD